MTDAGSGADAGADAGLPPSTFTRTITTITVSTGTIAASIDAEYGPYLGVLPDGRAKVAWCDPATSKIYVRHLDASLAVAQRADTVLDGYKLFGFVTHPDGRSAVLAVTRAPGSCTPCTASTSCVSCDQLQLVQLGDDGGVLQSRTIDDRLAHSGWFSGGGIALGTYAGVDSYAVARTVRGAGPATSASAFCTSSAGNSGHQWHETWLYRTSDLGTAASGCNVFPCGHSMFKRSVNRHPDRDGFGSVCMSDYTGARTGFNYALNNGWNSRLYNVWADWPNFVNGGTPSELVPANSGTWLVALAAPRSCASTCATDQHDLAVFEVGFDSRAPIGGPRWITSRVGWEKFPHLARYGPRYLLGWTTSDSTTADFNSPTHWWVAEIDASGAVVAGPVELPAAASFGYGTTWVTVPGSGDVVWARRASGTTIDLVRLRR